MSEHILCHAHSHVLFTTSVQSFQNQVRLRCETGMRSRSTVTHQMILLHCFRPILSSEKLISIRFVLLCIFQRFLIYRLHLGDPPRGLFCFFRKEELHVRKTRVATGTCKGEKLLMTTRKRRIDYDPLMEEKRVLSGDVNPWTNQKYSQKYYDILVKRKELPVFEQRDDFLNNLRSHQVIVLQGETGSGKTTQVCLASNPICFSRVDSPVLPGVGLDQGRTDGGLHAAAPCRCHVCGEACCR